MQMLEKYLKAKGYNRTAIAEILNVSAPTVRILLENPKELKISQVIKICDECGESFDRVGGLIFETHAFICNENIVNIKPRFSFENV